MAQVYAVVYDKKGNFIVAKKNLYGYFFYKNGKGEIVPDGQKLNGSGSYCFPGGKLEVKNPVAGALNEWEEETRDKLTEKFKQTPKYFSNTQYYGIYFLVPDDINIEDLKVMINKNLKEGADTAVEIQKKKITKYDEISPLSPKDNELELCMVVNYKDLDKYFTKNDNATGWFYNIVQDIKKKNKWE